MATTELRKTWVTATSLALSVWLFFPTSVSQALASADTEDPLRTAIIPWGVHSHYRILQKKEGQDAALCLEEVCETDWIQLNVSNPSGVLCLVTQLCLTLYDPTNCSPPGSSVHGSSLGKNTGVACHALLQGIFLAQELTLHLLHLLHWQADSLPPCHLGPWKERRAVLIYLISAKISLYSSSPHPRWKYSPWTSLWGLRQSKVKFHLDLHKHCLKIKLSLRQT